MQKKYLKIFFDTEFSGLTQSTSLISIALVAETGEEFYAEFTDYNQSQLDEWHQLNVLSKLFLDEKTVSFDLKKMYVLGKKDEIKKALEIWLNQFPIEKDKNDNIIPTIQFWADVPHYDWVLFCELFGGALYIPKQIHFMCMDIGTLLMLNKIDINIDREKLLSEEEQKSLNFSKKHNAYTFKVFENKIFAIAENLLLFYKNYFFKLKVKQNHQNERKLVFKGLNNQNKLLKTPTANEWDLVKFLDTFFPSVQFIYQ